MPCLLRRRSLCSTSLKTPGILANARHRVEELRALDRALMLRLDRHEYDFHLLATAVAYHYHYAFTPATAVAYAVEQRASQEE